MKQLPKAAVNVYKKIREKLSISAAFRVWFMWLPMSLGNPFLTALAAFGEITGN
jgi:hypothetical protein